ncbi:MAG: hypothetical protein GXX91_17420 [Verrucomicrobiaceae bacterium]|nr:hypothetical protein [Verrucomicrobiaceae bacterium]
MVRDDGTLDSSLCAFAPPEDREKEFTGLVDVALGRTEGSVEQESAVAVRGDGSLVWWGPATTAPGATDPPSDARRGIASVVSGRGVYIALRKNGKLVTWKFTSGGNRRAVLPSHVAEERFTQVVMSEQHSLGLKTNGEVIAWGLNNDGQCNVPPDLGKCTEVRVLHNVLSLARKQGGSWVAWGRDYGGMRDQLHGASQMTHVVGRLFPPGEYAYAVWIEAE